MDTAYKHNLCRFCLGSSGYLIDLFKENRAHGFILEDAIEELLRYKVSRFDGYPPFICLTCFGKLSNFRLFKSQCSEAMVAFENIYMRKGNLAVANETQQIPAECSPIKTEPEDGASDDYVPCEVSIKTEQDELDASCASGGFNEMQREISDDNYSEMEDGESTVQMHCGQSEETEYYSETGVLDHIDIKPVVNNRKDAVQMHCGQSGETEYYNESGSADHSDMKPEGPPQKRKSWDKISMIRAVEAVMNKQMSLLKAAKAFNVPRSTIKDYVKRNGKNSIDAAIGRKRVLPTEVENELVFYCLHMEQHFFGLTPKDVERMAYAVAMRNGLNNPFWEEKQGAGRKWIKQFFQRHKNLNYRRPQTLIAARMSGFTQENVTRFFSNLEPVMSRINFSPDRVFSVDETSLTVVQEKSSKVLGLKGKGQIECLSPAERETLVTSVICMSASGVFVPPMFIFPRTEVDNKLFNGAPEGTIGVCHPSGWVQHENFLHWFQHFVSTVKPTQGDPVVLVLDGHYSHNRSIDLIEFAHVNNVLLACLPPHSTHKMQPVDVAFMGPFKNHYLQEVDNWRKSHDGTLVTQYEVASLFGKAYNKTATVEVAANGFWKTGIFPFQRKAFGDHDFASNTKDMETKYSSQHQISSAVVQSADTSAPSNPKETDTKFSVQLQGSPVVSQSNEECILTYQQPSTSGKQLLSQTTYAKALHSTNEEQCTFPFQRKSFNDNNFASNDKNMEAKFSVQNPGSSTIVQCSDVTVETCNAKDMEAKFSVQLQGSSTGAQQSEMTCVLDYEQPSTSGKQVSRANVASSYAKLLCMNEEHCVAPTD